MQRYQIAIYMRLSKEDDRCREESNSITMQRILLQRYVKDNFSAYDLYEFCDDGYTGTNFERPGMQSMLERVRNAVIDCIIVKDFSRFARDYIELGSYLEQIFPFMGVRFISVNDKYDSDNYQGSIADIDVNFKNLLYDLYSKDLSQKIRSSLAVKKEQGQYVSGNSPFGYEKAPEDRPALLIAEDEAEVVRRIYTLAVEGYTSVEIARLFNETQIKTPIEFKIEKGKTSREPKGERFLWSSSTICQILKNEIYIGNIVQKKYKKDFVGGKNHLTCREDWLIAYNHHEPIIERHIFDKVQEGRGIKRNPQYNPGHPLIGKVVCGCCNKNLQYRRGLNPYFNCYHRYSNGMKNCVDKVNALFLEEYVLFMLQDKLRKNGELAKFQRKAVTRLDREIKEGKEQKRQLVAKVERLKHQSFEAYQSYVSGKSGSFQSDDRRVKSLEKELEDLQKTLLRREEERTMLEADCHKMNKGIKFAALPKEILNDYIEKIVVDNELAIEIVWREDLGMA